MSRKSPCLCKSLLQSSTKRRGGLPPPSRHYQPVLHENCEHDEVEEEELPLLFFSMQAISTFCT